MVASYCGRRTHGTILVLLLETGVVPNANGDNSYKTLYQMILAPNVTWQSIK